MLSLASPSGLELEEGKEKIVLYAVPEFLRSLTRAKEGVPPGELSKRR